LFKKLLIHNFRVLRSKLEVMLNGRAYVFFMNRVSSKHVAYKFKNLDFWIIENNNVHHFIKPRGGYFINGLKERTLELVKSYCIDKIEFQDDDLILDVGANTGDLIPYFSKQRYIGFEPSPAEFQALEKNTRSNCKIYDFAVGDNENEIDFYISSAGADSSMYQPLVVESKIRVKQIRLDNFINESVKLLKVDAEGAEIEVINGAKNLLSQIEFIAIDLGFEKGISQESTAPPVFNLLFENDFILVAIAKNQRYLFQNSKISSMKLQLFRNA
jgi:FkbM family methyltransferase